MSTACSRRRSSRPGTTSESTCAEVEDAIGARLAAAGLEHDQRGRTEHVAGMYGDDGVADRDAGAGLPATGAHEVLAGVEHLLVALVDVDLERRVAARDHHAGLILGGHR